MLCVGFHGTAVTDELAALLDAGVGAVVLFARNVAGPQQVAELCADIKRRAKHRVMICIDQEGGRVRRLRDGFVEIPSMRQLGTTGDADIARQLGSVVARELRAVNIDLNFAPVLDVDTNPANPVIADRSLGRESRRVAELGVAMIKGLQGEGVAACGKHFPGHGDTSQDSHYDLPRLSHDLDRLLRIELPPFAAAVEAGVAAVMSSHVIFEPLDDALPATMSRKVLHALLRERLKFDGVIISDDLEMKAVAANFAFEDVITNGVDAGIDLFCIAHSADTQRNALKVLADAVGSHRLARERLEASVARIDALAAKFYHAPVDTSRLGILNNDEHRTLVDLISGARRNGNGHHPNSDGPQVSDGTGYAHLAHANGNGHTNGHAVAHDPTNYK
jgi:beta-N-acetylhexosaminidase